jgi:uncharacterized protein YrrD
MLISNEKLIGCKTQASDGEIGKIENIFFDDQQWTVRHLVVKTGHWFKKREVLISPIAIREVNLPEHSVLVSLTKEQVQNAPDIDTEKPVSRQMEARYYDYYRWPYYWNGPQPWGLTSYPTSMLSPPYVIPSPIFRPENSEVGREEMIDTHLRSSKAVTGYSIEATDAEFGKVKDLIIDDKYWVVRYLVIDTSSFWPNKVVLISPTWVNSISWDDRSFRVNVSENQIKHSPEYFLGDPVTREYEDLLHNYYERPKYWEGDSEFDGTKSSHRRVS